MLLIALHCATIHEYGVGNCRLMIGLLGSWQEGLGSGFGWVIVCDLKTLSCHHTSHHPRILKKEKQMNYWEATLGWSTTETGISLARWAL